MASKVNIDSISESLSEVLKKADEFNIKKRSILENIKELERAIPLFERLVGLYEQVGENSPRANMYLRLAQQIASRNDEGAAAGYNDLKWEAKLADAENAHDRLSNEEAEAIGQLARSSKLADFVMEFNIEDLDRFQQFKELIAAVTEKRAGMSRKDAQTRRVAHVRDIMREYGTGRPKYPANDPYGTLADGDTPLFPTGDETTPVGDEQLPAVAQGVGDLHFRNGKWYRLVSQGALDGKITDQKWKRVSDKKAQAELGPSEYAAIRRRGELEEKAVASIEKTSSYIADLEPAGGGAAKKDKKEKKKKPKGDKQGWGEALLQLAKWASYGVATLGAIAGSAYIIEKYLTQWKNTQDNYKDNYDKLRNRFKTALSPENVTDVDKAAGDFANLRIVNSKFYPQLSEDISLIEAARAEFDDPRKHPVIAKILAGLDEDSIRAQAINALAEGKVSFIAKGPMGVPQEYYLPAMIAGIEAEGAEGANWAVDAAKAQQHQTLTSALAAFPDEVPQIWDSSKSFWDNVGSLHGNNVFQRTGRWLGANLRNWTNPEFYDDLTAEEVEKLPAEELGKRAVSVYFNKKHHAIDAFVTTGELSPAFKDLTGASMLQYRNDERIPEVLVGEIVASGDIGMADLAKAAAQGAPATYNLLQNKYIPRWNKERQQRGMPLLTREDAARITNELQMRDDYGAGEENIANAYEWYDAPRTHERVLLPPTVINQSYVTQTNVSADDNIQQVIGKQ